MFKSIFYGLSKRLTWYFFCLFPIPLLALFATSFFGTNANAQEKLQKENAPLHLTIYPAAETKPAFKYKLLPSYLEQTPGNAAVYYGKVTAEESHFFFQHDEIWDKMEKMRSMPLHQLRGESFSIGGIRRKILRAAHCTHCDWQLPIRGNHAYMVELPEVQQMRTFFYAIATQARMEMAHNDWNSSIESFQAGYAMGRHVAEGETYVNALVGITCCRLINKQLYTYVQQPKSPNLYWALTALPRPMIDFRKATEANMQFEEISYPELRTAESSKHVTEEWWTIVFRLWKPMYEIAFMEDSENAGPMRTEIEIKEICTKAHPKVKKALVRLGIDAETVETMSIPQAMLVYHARQVALRQQRAAKACYLPYVQAMEQIEKDEEQSKSDTGRFPMVLPWSDKLIISPRMLMNAQARNERAFAILRIIEALRIYGANHDGKLPEKLSDITEVPIPLDTATGKPFLYDKKKDGGIFLKGGMIPKAPNFYYVTMKQIEKK